MAYRGAGKPPRKAFAPLTAIPLRLSEQRAHGDRLMRFTIATYNIHKGFSHLRRKVVIHELKERLHGLSADVLFLQEVQGVHRRHARRYRNWPGKPQHEFIADAVWHEVAYGRSAGCRPCIASTSTSACSSAAGGGRCTRCASASAKRCRAARR